MMPRLISFGAKVCFNRQLSFSGLTLVVMPALLVVLAMGSVNAANPGFIDDTQIKTAIDQIAAASPTADHARLEKGVRQAAGFWRAEDGTPAEFVQFCKDNFIADTSILRQTADRLEKAFESINGHFEIMGRDLVWNLDVETGPILPIDYVIAQYSPSAHVDEDMFKIKLAFIVLLNFPQYSLDDRLKLGATWTSEKWMEARLAGLFDARVPADVEQALTKAYTDADDYISHYNIHMHHLLTPDGKRPFPEGMRLISHWNLRDELKSLYAEKNSLPAQKMIYDVMLKIIRQEIPKAVIDNPAVDWTVSKNIVTVSPAIDGPVPSSWKQSGKPGTVVDNSAEPCARYAQILNSFHAQQAADKYYPGMPTMIDRSFQVGREIPEAKVESMLVAVLSSDVAKKTGKLIEKRLGRKLQPFDIWYDGFRARGSISETKLDSMVKAKYPTVQAFQADLGNILQKLGFDAATSEYLTSRITVDPSRGSGHAAEPGNKSDKAHLRTRVGAKGMDYKGYNIATHEFGHNVEQVFSLNRVDHTLLRGVPNSAFTEAFAFVFQEQDLRLLGLPDQDPDAKYLKDIDTYWQMFEISGVALVDMRMWHWLYAHPEATPQQLRDAVITIAKEVWNTYYAPVLGIRDVELLAVYSHMISNSLYLPDYPLGHMISFQIEKYLEGKNLGKEMERMCSTGSIAPDLWMQKAVGSPVSPKPLIQAAEEGLAKVGTK